jgi:hypothetical protein
MEHLEEMLLSDPLGFIETLADPATYDHMVASLSGGAEPSHPQPAGQPAGAAPGDDQEKVYDMIMSHKLLPKAVDLLESILQASGLGDAAG